jgi:very-short-patch-repair endonuclease
MNKQSKTEDMLYEAMLALGLRPKRQYKISRMHVDFAFLKEKLVVEVDGPYKRNHGGMKSLFERRRACEKEGWKVENFTAEEVYENPQKIAWRIKNIINNPNHITSLSNFENNTKITKPYIPLKPSKIKKYSPKIINAEYMKDIKKEEIESRKRYELKEKEKKRRKIIIVCIIAILILFFSGLIFNNQKQTLNQKQDTTIIPEKVPPITNPPIEPIIVEGSKTDVIITNNQNKDTSVNVTYRIFSNWFGIDSTENKIFEVSANNKQSFQVYYNDGCSTAPCSVSIISYKAR